MATNTRTATNREFQSLKEELEEHDLYEKGMQIEQMRQIHEILSESTAETSFSVPAFSALDIELATKESELDFQPHEMLSSTIINHSMNTNILESGYHCDSREVLSPSPDVHHELVVVADVHHELNWSPKHKNEQDENYADFKILKRTASGTFIPGSQVDSGICEAERVKVCENKQNEAVDLSFTGGCNM